MKLIVGLGNPGQQYKLTRHNIGFIFIDEYLKDRSISGVKNKFNSEITERFQDGEKIIFQKPLTFMNLSGEAIIKVVNFYKLNPEEDVFIVYDDLDLPFLKTRIRNTGSSGGHNGMKSIINYLGKNFNRIRIGIDKPKGYDTADYVLGRFNEDEKKSLIEKKEEIFNIFDDIIDGKNIISLMNKYNK